MERGISRVALVALTSWLTASSALAQAPTRPRAALWVVGLDPVAAAAAPRVQYHAEQALVRSGRFELVRLVDALDPQGAGARQSRQAEADSAMAAGQKAYESLETQRAVGLFDKAVKAYEGTDLTRNFQSLSKAWVMRIASHVANGDVRAARAEVDRLLPLNPRAEFSPRYFPPDELAYVERVRRAVAAAGKTALSVRAEAAFAQVYLNGQFRGVTPGTLSKLPPADHFLTLVATGYKLEQDQARSGTLELRLTPAPRADLLREVTAQLSDEPAGAGRDEAARKLGRELGVNQVVLAVLRAAGAGELDVVALRLDVEDGHNAAYQETRLPVGEAAAPAADALFSSLVSEDAPRVAGPVKHYKGGLRWTRQRTGYVLLGVAAGLLGTGTFFGVKALKQQHAYRTLPQTSPDTGTAARRTRQYALTADLTLLGGLLAAGVGGYLSFWPTGSPDAAEAEVSKADPLPMPPPPRGAARRRKADNDLRED